LRDTAPQVLSRQICSAKLVWSVLVVEPQSEIYNIPRAMYFDGEVMRIFQAMGLEREISERSTQGKNCLYQWRG
jgi:2-polyprenyl-6-methoxyphenol hydroxylase-like FAD-dependent oxidoreductase